jgi:hypothetical protein
MTAIVLQELNNHTSHMVVTRLADEVRLHATTAQRDDGVKGGTARDSMHWLIVPEDDV